jgi:hypothetical protein
VACRGTPLPTLGAHLFEPGADLLKQFRKVAAILSGGGQDNDARAGAAPEGVIRSRCLRDRFSPEGLQTMIDLYRLGSTARQVRNTVSACAASSDCCTSTAYVVSVLLDDGLDGSQESAQDPLGKLLGTVPTAAIHT